MSIAGEDLIRCRKLIEEKLQWGESESWQSADFEQLSQLISESTGVSLSVSTLRRIWGKVEYNHLPSMTTLNTLSKYAAGKDWRSFVSIATTSETQVVNHAPVGGRKSSKWYFVITVGAMFVAVLALVLVKTGESTVIDADYSFSSRPVSKGIPNSVVFTYDASNAPTDSVFIQQSWDESRRALIDRKIHKHTSIYYQPGFYVAKLVVGSTVVKAHNLLIPSDGWAGYIDQKPIPVYLKPQKFVKPNLMKLPLEGLRETNVPLQPQTPILHFANVGNFRSLPLTDFSFSAEVKNEFNAGTAACQFSGIVILTDDMPIAISLSAKGCVSELNLTCVDEHVSGKKADLSLFGVDFSEWAKVECKSVGKEIVILINGRFAHKAPVPTRAIHVVGLSFSFAGIGSVRKVRLSDHSGIVYEAF